MQDQSTTYQPPPHQPLNSNLICMDCSTDQDLIHLDRLRLICRNCYNGSTCSSQYPYDQQGQPQLQPDYNQITPQIFLGNEDTARDHNFFQQHNISAVIACGAYLLSPFDHLYDYKKYNIGDMLTQQIINLLDDNYQWMQMHIENGKKILVHCMGGVSRSASFVIAYLMRANGYTFQEAYKIVKEKRKIICPNKGFIKQLKEYQNQLKIVKKDNKKQTL